MSWNYNGEVTNNKNTTNPRKPGSDFLYIMFLYSFLSYYTVGWRPLLGKNIYSGMLRDILNDKFLRQQDVKGQ